jgi:hypothetical protein
MKEVGRENKRKSGAYGLEIERMRFTKLIIAYTYIKIKEF